MELMVLRCPAVAAVFVLSAVCAVLAMRLPRKNLAAGLAAGALGIVWIFLALAQSIPGEEILLLLLTELTASLLARGKGEGK